LWITRHGQVLVKFALEEVPDERSRFTFSTSFMW
jgi:hypothetical protein